MTTDSFGFVLNLYEYSGKLPLELSPGIFLDAATPEQRFGIELFLKDYESSFIGGTHVYFVERYVDRSKIPGRLVWPPSGNVPLWVLNFSPGAGSIWELCKGAQLTESELEIALTFHPTRPPMPHQIEPARIFHFSQSHIDPVYQLLDIADVTRSKDFADKIRDFRVGVEDEAKSAVVRIFDDFVALSAGQRYGHLPLLGLFAAIEALITHDPHEFGDSLNHQLSTKMPLLMRRFRQPINIPDYFQPDCDPARAWKLLYDVRSRYAHGGVPDFTKGKLKQLRNFHAVFRFVRAATKRLIIQALEEPQLIFDLKSC